MHCGFSQTLKRLPNVVMLSSVMQNWRLCLRLSTGELLSQVEVLIVIITGELLSQAEVLIVIITGELLSQVEVLVMKITWIKQIYIYICIYVHLQFSIHIC